MTEVLVVGGGLAGCECAFQLAERGVDVCIVEQKPDKRTPAQIGDGLAELVCSNSFRGAALTNAVGLLKEEMRRAGSLVMSVGDEVRAAAAEVGADPSRVHEDQPPRRPGMLPCEGTGQGVQRRLAGSVAAPAAAAVEGDRSELRRHQHDQAVIGDPLAERLREADRAHGVGLEYRARDRAGHLASRGAGLRRHPGHDEQAIEVRRVGQPFREGRHRGIVVDVDAGLDPQGAALPLVGERR